MSSGSGLLLACSGLSEQNYRGRGYHAEDEDSASSNTSLITMPPTTASLKTHTGHGHKKASEAVTEGSRSRHHSGHRNRHHHRSRHHDLSPGITTPTPVQQSSEVSKKMLTASLQFCDVSNASIPSSASSSYSLQPQPL